MRFDRILVLAVFALFSISCGEDSPVGSNGKGDRTTVWQQTNGPLGGGVNAIVANTGGQIYVGASSDYFAGVFRSDDGGSSWSVMSGGLPASSFIRFLTLGQDMLIYAVTWDGMYRTTFNGDSWTQIGIDSPNANSLAVNFEGHIYAGINNGVIHSTDGGDLWETTSLNNVLINHIAVGPNDHIFAVGGEIVYRSTDDGVSWMDFSLNSFIFSIAVNSDNNIFVGSTGSIFRSTDDGDSWSEINIELSNSDIEAIAFHPDGKIYAIDRSELFRSEDDGDNWIKIDLDMTISRPIHSIFIDPNGVIYLGTGSGIHRSIDDGENWERIGVPNSDVWVVGINSEGDLFAGTDNGTFRSENSGNTWERIELIEKSEFKSNLSNIAFSPDGFGFVGDESSNRLFRSLDNGASWSVSLEQVDVGEILISSSGYVFVGEEEQKIYRSSDNGETWERLENGLEEAQSFLALVETPDGDIFGGGFGEEGIYHSTDNGDSWVLGGLEGNPIWSLAVNSAGDIFAGTTGGVYYSADNGSSWTLFNITGGYVFSIVVSTSDDIFAGTFNFEDEDILPADGVLVSRDNGDTWNRMSGGGIKSLPVTSLTLGANANLFAGTLGGGVFRTSNSSDGN